MALDPKKIEEAMQSPGLALDLFENFGSAIPIEDFNDSMVDLARIISAHADNQNFMKLLGNYLGQLVKKGLNIDALVQANPGLFRDANSEMMTSLFVYLTPEQQQKILEVSGKSEKDYVDNNLVEISKDELPPKSSELLFDVETRKAKIVKNIEEAEARGETVSRSFDTDLPASEKSNRLVSDAFIELIKHAAIAAWTEIKDGFPKFRKGLAYVVKLPEPELAAKNWFSLLSGIWERIKMAPEKTATENVLSDISNVQSNNVAKKMAELPVDHNPVQKWNARKEESRRNKKGVFAGEKKGNEDNVVNPPRLSIKQQIKSSFRKSC